MFKFSEFHIEPHGNTRNFNLYTKHTQTHTIYMFEHTFFQNQSSPTKTNIKPTRNIMFVFMILLIFHLLQQYLLFGVPRRYRFIYV